jgi:hypothetical protein
MKAGVKKRLTWLELALTTHNDDPEPVVVDLSVFSDAELDRLEWFAEQCAGWPRDDWIETGLAPAERIELDGLMAKTRPAPE